MRNIENQKYQNQDQNMDAWKAGTDRLKAGTMMDTGLRDRMDLGSSP